MENLRLDKRRTTKFNVNPGAAARKMDGRDLYALRGQKFENATDKNHRGREDFA
jgi:hypothetical protein